MAARERGEEGVGEGEIDLGFAPRGHRFALILSTMTVVTRGGSWSGGDDALDHHGVCNCRREEGREERDGLGRLQLPRARDNTLHFIFCLLLSFAFFYILFDHQMDFIKCGTSSIITMAY